MKSTLKRIFSLALIAAFSTSLAIGDRNFKASGDNGALFSDVTGEMDLTDIAVKNLNSSVLAGGKTYETRTVIVSLEGDTLVKQANGADVSSYASSKEGKRAQKALKKSQDAFLKKLSKSGISYSLENRYSAVENAVAIKVNTKYVADIKAMSGVSGVYVSETYAAPETVSETYSYEATASGEVHATINNTSVYPTGVYDSSSVLGMSGITSDNSVVAIIDTGLDYTHKAFQIYADKYPMNNARFDETYVADKLSEKDLIAEQRAATQGEKLAAKDLYISRKVPFAYDYADNDADVYPSYSNHGTHVAGIVAGYSPDGYTDKDGNKINEPFVGVAPEAQLVICKVFSDNIDDADVGGADTEDILAALEDCVMLGVDVINMSLGTSCGFSTVSDEADEEGMLLERVYSSVRNAGISLVCAGSNDYSAGYGGNFGTNLASNPDSGTVGSPSVYPAALSVASISGQRSPYMLANENSEAFSVYYEESSDQNNKYFDFAKLMLGDKQSETFEYVVVPGVGRVTDYASVRNLFKATDANGNKRIALVKRGDTSFKDKVDTAKSMGAAAIIVYNNVAGTIRMSLGDAEDPIPSASVSKTAGERLVQTATGRIGTLKIDKSLLAGPFMSDFSSWGVTPDLRLKPEITAHGGEITSAVPGGYGEMSGTSMASPNMAGVVSIIRSYLKTKDPAYIADTNALTQRVNQLIMSTATIVYDRDGLPYSPRKQGAGLGSLENAVKSNAYLSTNDTTIDLRPNVNLGDDPDKSGVYEFTFNVSNFGSSALEFTFKSTFMTETRDEFSVAEQAHLLGGSPEWNVLSGNATKSGDKLAIPAGGTAEIKVKLTLSAEEKKYIDDNFVNGMYVEGFISLLGEGEQCDLTLPFMGFYGDWAAAPMLDYNAYEIDASLADASVDDANKLKASVWATQPYTMYYNEQYSMPMGTFAYLQDENADRVYTVEEHNAISCFNDYYGEGNGNNYLTAWQFRGLYVGLLRGARTVKYTLRNVDTGEIIYKNTAYRIGKAYTGGGGSGRPAFVKFELNPLEYGLVSNGRYAMDFYFESDSAIGSENTNTASYSFTFTADYEAPVLQDVRVRYYDYKDGNKDKQQIYLDLDVYDNHYAQSALLCYYADGELKQVNDYVQPIYNSVKNGTNTVSIDITDIYAKYKDQLYVQLDDYALNHSVYALNLSANNSKNVPDSFELAPGENSLSLKIYETHKALLSYEGGANYSNFSWSSANRNVADVKNGEIVGLSEGSTKITVSNGKVYRTIDVTVSGEKARLSVPSLSFGTIRNKDDNLVTASGYVEVYPDQDITLTVQTDPWYYPEENIRLRWEAGNTAVCEVDQNGKLNFKKKGTSSVIATLLDESGNPTAYSATVTVRVLDPFVVSNYTLTHYRGKDKTVEIPTDKNIMYIGEDAFEDNSTMEEVILPKTVVNINQRAFNNCTALKRIYAVSKEKQEIADSDLNLVYTEAFIGCTSLETIDLSNVKVITLGRRAFYGCTSLKEIINMQAIGTAFDGAFEGCVSLTGIDLSGMHVAGQDVFKDCVALAAVQTDKYSAIGKGMFRNCTSLKSIVLKNSSIGDNSFENCSALTKVTIDGNGDDYVIGSEAFLNSGLSEITIVARVRKIGDRAFANTSISEITLPEGLTEIGENIFAGCTKLDTITLPASFSLKDVKLAGNLFNGRTVKFAASSQFKNDGGVLYSADGKILYAVLDGSVNSVTIPAGVEEIYDYAFESGNVGSITIPASVKRIGKGAFRNSKLSAISFAEGSQIAAIEDETFYGSRLLAIQLPSSVTSIGSYAFSETLLKNIELGESVKSIGSYAFQLCEWLASATIPASVEEIGNYAFRNCVALKNIEIPAVKRMGIGVFVSNAALKSAKFGAEAETTGTSTFVDCSELEEVTIGGKTSEIGASAFDTRVGYYGARNSALKKVTLGESVKSIGNAAFYGCSSLNEIDLSHVETIGAMAFYNCGALRTLELNEAISIGEGAFAVDNGSAGSSSVSVPKAQEIGISAFEGTGAQKIVLPASLKKLGYAAFAYAKNLTAFETSGNSVYFAQDGVLYKNAEDGNYELAAYPAAKVLGAEEYRVIDRTMRIEAYAFAGKKDSNFKKIVLPYSLKTIGKSCFYQSGIIEYTFESINAPALETEYRSDVEQILQNHVNSENPMSDPAINSYYYANFNTLFVNYIDMVGEKSDLTLNYPTNGVGYDNFVYSRYFGTKNTTGVLINDDTRKFLELVDGFVPDSEIAEWAAKASAGDTATYAAAVNAFSEQVKEARRIYSNTTDPAQLAFIPAEKAEKLAATESALRPVKKAYGIKVSFSLCRYEGNYKSVYNEGETFDMAGLVVYAVYDDYSEELIPQSKLRLVTTDELTQYHKSVDIIYTDDSGIEHTIYVGVTVNPAGTTGGEDTPEKTPKKHRGLIIGLSIAGGVIVCGGAAAATVILLKKKNKRRDETENDG